MIHYLLKPIDFRELEQSIEAASRKLNQQRLLCSPSHDQLEKQEVYLKDLLKGYPTDKISAALQFRQLGFPFSYEESPGVLLRSTLQHTIDWSYGKEGLILAISNILRMLLQPYYLLPLFSGQDHCDILLVHPRSPQWDLQEYICQTKELLDIDIDAVPLFCFSSFEELRTGNYSNYIPDYDSSDSLEKAYDTYFSENSPEEKSVIYTAIEYINSHYMEDLTRDDVASKVFMCGAHFSRCFKKETGITYLDYLIDLRMKKAIELLQTNCKIQDIAKKIGYTSQNRFIINFRHYTSYTPSEYRRKVLNIM